MHIGYSFTSKRTLETKIVFRGSYKIVEPIENANCPNLLGVLKNLKIMNCF